MNHTLETTGEDEVEWKNGLKDWVKDLENNPPVLKPVTFQLKGYANAKEVYVTGSFNGWSANQTKLEHKNNLWTTTVVAEPGKVTYKFIVDGNYLLDPGNPKTEKDNAFTNSLKIVE